MNRKTYIIILSLLSICISGILFLQGIWIRNFYLQKKEQFESGVYSVLNEVAEKLSERKKIEEIKMTYIVVGNDTVAKTPSRNLSIRSENTTNIINRTLSNVKTITKKGRANDEKMLSDDSVLITRADSNIRILLAPSKGGKKAKIILSGSRPPLIKKQKDSLWSEVEGESVKLFPEIEETERLLNKMVTEIRVLNTETENADTLKSLLKRHLFNRGLFLPFEFSFSSGKPVKKIAQSAAFDSTKSYYKNNVSNKRIFDNGSLLMLQFPAQNDFVMSGLKSSLILSAIFSVIVVLLFIIVVRLILQQKKLSEIKNDFVNNMTHELKTPIATISLALDAMDNPVVRDDPERYGVYKKVLKEENNKLNRHVERVLQLSLMDKGAMEINKVTVNIVELLQESIRHYTLLIHEKNATVNFVCTDKELLLKVDVEHMKSVFNNLLDNALKYSPDSCLINISITKTADKIEIIYADNGIGIQKEQQSRVFEKFYRVQGGNLHDVKGFGLGLSFVKNIIEAHGGSIYLESEPNKGSNFKILLNASE